MLAFAAALYMIIPIRDLDGASYRVSKEHNECGRSMQSSVISRSPLMTRRLIIFESITESDNQRHDEFPRSIGYEEGCTASDDDESVNDILKNSITAHYNRQPLN